MGSKSEKFNINIAIWKKKQKNNSHFGCTNNIFVDCTIEAMVIREKGKLKPNL